MVEFSRKLIIDEGEGNEVVIPLAPQRYVDQLFDRVAETCARVAEADSRGVSVDDLSRPDASLPPSDGADGPSLDDPSSAE